MDKKTWKRRRETKHMPVRTVTSNSAVLNRMHLMPVRSGQLVGLEELRKRKTSD